MGTDRKTAGVRATRGRAPVACVAGEPGGPSAAAGRAVRRLAIVAALGLPTLYAPAARADDRATAQQLFQQGKDLMAAGSYEQACAKFDAAADLSQTVGVRLNLADCYLKLGKTASAWIEYDDALTLAERSGDTAATNLARTRQAQLKPSLSYMTVVVSAATADMEVTRDGQKVPQAAWGVAVPVNPGDHEIRASAPGRKAWSGKVSVAGAGGSVNVAVPALEQDSSPPAGATPAGAASAETAPAAGTGLFSGPGGTQRTVAVVSAGLGVAGLAVGTIFGVEMLSKQNDYKQHENTATGRCLDLQCQTLSQDAVQAGNVATVGFIAGGVLAATGVVLWLTAHKASKAEVVLAPTAHGGGFLMQGSF